MSKKHYIALAAILNRRINQPDIDNLALCGRVEAKEIAKDIAAWLQINSPTFDKARFLKACGV